NRVTIRNAEGKVLWSYGGTMVPVACYPLAGGNVLVAEWRTVTEVTPAAQPAWSRNFYGVRGVPNLQYPRLLPGGHFVGLSEPPARACVWSGWASTPRDPRTSTSLPRSSIAWRAWEAGTPGFAGGRPRC